MIPFVLSVEGKPVVKINGDPTLLAIYSPLFENTGNPRYVTISLPFLDQREFLAAWNVMHDKSKSPGIGSAVRKYLTMFKVDEKKIPYNNAVCHRTCTERFMSIHDISLKKAHIFYTEFSCRTLADLERVELNDAQKMALLHNKDLVKRIPRSEIDEWSVKLGAILADCKWTITGSYRREEKDSGDIDILAEEGKKSIVSIVAALESQGLLVGTLANGTKKFMGIVRLRTELPARRLDIRICTAIEWPYCLLYSTGSKALNILMRTRANSMSLRLNEYCLKSSIDKDNRYPAITEEDIFKHLKLQYIPPEKRVKTIKRLEVL